jgi:hypothetical protein
MFLRTNLPLSAFHQDNMTGWKAYKMDDPAPDVPGGLRFLLSFAEGRRMEYRRKVGRKLVPLEPPLPDDFATAEVVAQSARAAGVGGWRVPGNDLFHGRINSPVAGAQQQRRRVEVSVRLDVRLPGQKGVRDGVPTALRSSDAYSLFHGKPYQGVGRSAGGGRPRKSRGTGPVSEEDLATVRHCARCREPLSGTSSQDQKEVINTVTFWTCNSCYHVVRGQQDVGQLAYPNAAKARQQQPQQQPQEGGKGGVLRLGRVGREGRVRVRVHGCIGSRPAATAQSHANSHGVQGAPTAPFASLAASTGPLAASCRRPPARRPRPAVRLMEPLGPGPDARLAVPRGVQHGTLTHLAPVSCGRRGRDRVGRTGSSLVAKRALKIPPLGGRGTVLEVER